MPHILSFATPEETANELAGYLLERINRTANQFYLAISGGNTPKMLFEALAKKENEIHWQKIKLYWVDERCVAPDNVESNFRLTNNSLLKKVPVSKENIHRIQGELLPKEALFNYLDDLAQVPHRNNLPQFDCIILGMGDDGHTASIFPTEIHLLKETKAAAVGTNPYSGQKRITLTGPSILQAKELIFHITGSGKAKVLDSILNKKTDYKEYPAAHFSDHTNLCWYVDEAALEG